MRSRFRFVIALAAAVVLSCRTTAQSEDPYLLVQALRQLPDAIRAIAPSDGRPDPVEERRRTLYKQLVDLGEQGLPALIAALRDPDDRVRHLAAQAIGGIGPKSCVRGSCARRIVEIR